MRSTIKIVAGILIASFGAINLFAQCPVDPKDGVLCAYELTESQLATFNAGGSTMSAFWTSDWANRDYIELNTADNSMPGRDSWDGDNDAKIIVKAAVSGAGLYFYAEVTDNIWVDPLADTWQYDAVDFYLDQLSSEELKVAIEPLEGRVSSVASWAISKTTKQIQVWMGESSQRRLSYNFYDNLFATWSSNPLTAADLKSQYDGMSAEIRAGSVNTVRVQEWFVPWKQLGLTNPPAGKKIAFCAGYNDMDGETDVTLVCSLRWGNGYDPFALGATPIPAGGISPDAANSWGDIQCPPTIGALSAKNSVRGVLPLQRMDGSNEFYSLTGRRIVQPANSHLFNGVLVKRIVTHSGSSIAIKAVNGK